MFIVRNTKNPDLCLEKPATDGFAWSTSIQKEQHRFETFEAAERARSCRFVPSQWETRQVTWALRWYVDGKPCGDGSYANADGIVGRVRPAAHRFTLADARRFMKDHQVWRCFKREGWTTVEGLKIVRLTKKAKVAR